MFGSRALRTAVMAGAVGSLVLSVPEPARAQGNCDNCDLPPSCRGNGDQKPKKNGRDCQTLNLSIESDMDFGRMVIMQSGEGRVLMDLTTGDRTVIGDVDDLGGVPITGQATVTGAPFQALRVRFPSQVSMRDATGGQAQIADFVTDLPAFPTLDSLGQLTFRFSGTLVISSNGGASGRLRGRVPISVEYQ